MPYNGSTPLAAPRAARGRQGNAGQDVGEDDPHQRTGGTMRGTYTRGVLFVHSTPPALCPHIEWALGTALGQEVHLQWSDQGAAPGMVRCEFAWVGPIGSGARLASALRGWEHLRYEVTEEPTASADGGRWCHTPSRWSPLRPWTSCARPSSWRSARRGTTSSSPCATLALALPFAGSTTAWADDGDDRRPLRRPAARHRGGG